MFRAASFLLAAHVFAVSASGAESQDSLKAGLSQLEKGNVEAAYPHLIPSLSGLNVNQLLQLEQGLAAKKHPYAEFLVLRYHASLGDQFSPVTAKAAESAFRIGQWTVCRDLLAPHVFELDSVSARLLLMSNFYEGGKLNPVIIRRAASRSRFTEVQSLAALNLSLQGSYREARVYLNRNTPQAIRSYVQAQELAAADKVDEAAEYFRQSLDSQWPEFKAVATAELYRHFALTGNRYKADQVWNGVKEEVEADTLPGTKELMAHQFALRGYEKQAMFLYRNLYRSGVPRAAVLNALWSEMVVDDSTGLLSQIQSLVMSDSLDCDANRLAMRFFRDHQDYPGVVRYGVKTVAYCPDAVEPYSDVGNALLELRRAVEAKVYFAKYLERGGDRNKVPTYMR
jgi:tetratricopeptide (TPR) repeat protein